MNEEIDCLFSWCSFLVCLSYKYICINILENHGNRCKINIIERHKHKDKYSMGAWRLTRDFRNRSSKNVSGRRSVFSTFGHTSLNMRLISGKNIGSCEWSIGLPCFIITWGYSREAIKVWRESKTKWVWFFETLNVLLIRFGSLNRCCHKSSSIWKPAHLFPPSYSSALFPWLLNESLTSVNTGDINSFIKANSLPLWKVDRLLRNVLSLHQWCFYFGALDYTIMAS